MKFNFDLILPYMPRNKCGAEVLGAAAVTGASALFNTLSQQSTNESNQRFNRTEAEKNRSFQSKEAEKARLWAADEWSRQFNKQASEWYNQLAAQQRAQQQNFMFEAEYNSPQNQASRLAQAGMNPSALLGGQGSSGLVSAASGNIGSAPSPSAPSGGAVPVTAPSGSSASVTNQAPQIDLSSMGTFLSQLSKAYRDNKEMRPSIDLLRGQYLNAIADAHMKEQMKDMYVMENEVLSKTKDTKVKQAYQDLINSYQDFKVKVSMEKDFDASAVYKAAETYLSTCKAKLTTEQYNQAVFVTTHQLQTFNLEVKEANSRILSNYASANANNALAEKYRAEVTDINERLLTFMTEAPYEYSKKKYDYITAKKNYEILKWQMPALIHKAYLDNMMSKAEYQMTMHKIKNLDQDSYEKIFRNIEKSKMIDARTSPINWLLQYIGGETLARLFAGGAI